MFGRQKQILDLRHRLDSLEGDRRIDDLAQRALESDERVSSLDERVSGLENDGRLGDLAQRLSALESDGRVSALGERVSGLENDGRLGDLAQRLFVLESDGRVFAIGERVSDLENDGRLGDLARRLSVLQNDGRLDNLEQRFSIIDELAQRIDSLERITAEFPSRRSYSIEAEDLLAETIFCVALGHLMHYGGTYLDIGAAHPITHSNTFYFYEHGWHGICVEPNPDYHNLYSIHRSRDKAFNVGLAAQSETLRYHRFKQPLINGFYGQDLVDRHIARGEVYLGYSDLKCCGIREFLRDHVKESVDFLNIDVQTLEAEILASWDWQACRPKVICTEIHTSDINSMLETEVAQILGKAGYAAVCRGWLSAIFVANECLPNHRSRSTETAAPSEPEAEREMPAGGESATAHTPSRQQGGDCAQADLEAIPGSTPLGQFIRRPDPDLLENDVLKGLRVVDRILLASDEEMASRDFLLARFLDYGIPVMTSEIFQAWAPYMNQSGFGALQFPTEFIDCVRKLMSLNIKSAIEVGVFRGGSSYFLAAVLQRVCSDFHLIMVDVQDSLLAFDRFSQVLKLDKAIPRTSDDFKGKVFDFVFIDADHSYSGAMRDFTNLGKYARALAFHDIHGHEFDELEGGTVRAWAEIKESLFRSHEVYEFAHSGTRSLGIGLAVCVPDATTSKKESRPSVSGIKRRRSVR